jgi:hypothetical protein
MEIGDDTHKSLDAAGILYGKARLLYSEMIFLGGKNFDGYEIETGSKIGNLFLSEPLSCRCKDSDLKLKLLISLNTIRNLNFIYWHSAEDWLMTIIFAHIIKFRIKGKLCSKFVKI